MKKIIQTWHGLFTPHRTTLLNDLGLLLARVIFGGMMAVGHGWPKLMGFAEKKDSFPDPLGIGSTLSLSSAIANELVLGALLVLGFGTRLISIPLAFTMFVACFIVSAKAPFFFTGQGPAQEVAFLYMMAYIMLALTGPGQFSLDAVAASRSRSRV